MNMCLSLIVYTHHQLNRTHILHRVIWLVKKNDWQLEVSSSRSIAHLYICILRHTVFADRCSTGRKLSAVIVRRQRYLLHKPVETSKLSSQLHLQLAFKSPQRMIVPCGFQTGTIKSTQKQDPSQDLNICALPMHIYSSAILLRAEFPMVWNA